MEAAEKGDETCFVTGLSEWLEKQTGGKVHKQRKKQKANCRMRKGNENGRKKKLHDFETK